MSCHIVLKSGTQVLETEMFFEFCLLMIFVQPAGVELKLALSIRMSIFLAGENIWMIYSCETLLQMSMEV